MNRNLSPIIKPEELLNLIDDEYLLIFDASNNPSAQVNYAAKHLKGSFFVDVNSQLAAIEPSAANRGRHPLPSAKKFCATLEELGISRESHVVIYDDKQGANAAARFWWMLKAFAHEKVQVLNGGIDAAISAGFPLSDSPEKIKRGKYECHEWNLPIADLAEVEKASGDESFLVIDVREPARYSGEIEPLDKIAGHIPNSKNIFFAENLNEKGFFLTPEKLRAKYEEQLKDFSKENIIVHCGSGITACHTLLALDYAGFEIPKLYVGSWSEWSSNNRPIARQDDND
jgi:thiosulfate/3-mercaptopyruvate sulfurtransferase